MCATSSKTQSIIAENQNVTVGTALLCPDTFLLATVGRDRASEKSRYTTDIHTLMSVSLTFQSLSVIGTITEPFNGNPLLSRGDEIKLKVIKCRKFLN